MARLASTRIYGNLIVDNQITSSVATGTAPFVISSTTLVTNLNANYLGGASLTTTFSTTSDVLVPSSKSIYTWVTGLGYTTSSGVTSVSLTGGANNGTLKLTVNGSTTDNIAVTGLGSAAYTSSTAYASSSHTHAYSLVNLNGTAATNSTATFFAPITGATVGNYPLFSGGTNAAPIWGSTVLGSMAYVANTGTTSINTLGTISTGVWEGTVVGIPYGGTGATTATLALAALGGYPSTNPSGYITINHTQATLNGTASTAPSFYAPTTAGTNLQYLKSNGSGAPTWETLPTSYTPSSHTQATLNGSASTLPAFYAPTTGGTSSDYALVGAASGAPQWLTRSGIDTRTEFPPDIHDHSAADITSGTLSTNIGGTGQTTYTNGQLLIGNGTLDTLSKATLTQGTGISITNGEGTITLALANHSTDFLTSGTIATARLGSGTASATSWLRGDSTWQSLPTFSDNLTSLTTITNDSTSPGTATWSGGYTSMSAYTYCLLVAEYYLPGSPSFSANAYYPSSTAIIMPSTQLFTVPYGGYTTYGMYTMYLTSVTTSAPVANTTSENFSGFRIVIRRSSSTDVVTSLPARGTNNLAVRLKIYGIR